MKQLLLILALLASSARPISAQNCPNFNLPAPLADSCHKAPLLCGNYLEGFCSSTAGLTPDQPGFATNQIPQFENNGWLRITPCEDSITIDFQVFDCLVGNELGFFLLSGDCDTMTLQSSISAQDGSVAQLTAGGLTPGEIYYLAVEGLNNADCKFQAHVVSGIGTASPGLVTCDCTDNAVVGPVDICPGDILEYNLVAGSCTMTVGPPTGGNGYFCCPDTCPAGKDSLVLHWIVPTWMTIVGDSINVNSITVQVGSSLLGIDTVLTGTVSYFWEIIHLTPSDSSFYCDCCQGCKPGDSPLDVIMHHDVETNFCELTCVQPCCFYNGQSYCSPGTYIVEQTNCLTKKLVITANWALPTADAGWGGVLTCINPSVTLWGNSSSGPNYEYLWSGPGVSPFSQHQPSITVWTPGVYTLVVTNTANGCTSSDNTFVVADFSIPGVMIPPVPKACYGEEVTLTAIGNPSNAVYNWSNNMIGQQITFDALATSAYTVTVTNPFNGCTSTAVSTVQVQPFVLTNLGPKTICEGECIYVAGDELCDPGAYSLVTTSYQGCDSIISLIINVIPDVVTNHGKIGTLTCAVTSIFFKGNVYNQPGNYIVSNSNGCGEDHFMIDLDNSPPQIELGQQQEICAGQTATLSVSPVLPSVEYTWSNNTVGTQNEVSPTGTTTYTVTATNLLNGCISSDQVTVNVNPPVDTDFGVVGMLTCNQLEVNFLGNIYTQPGQYAVPIPGGCGNNLFEILSDITPPWCPVIPVPPICAGESVTLQTAPPFPSSLNYLWSTGDTTQEVTVTPLVTSIYMVTATDPITGCMSTVATNVVVNQPQLVQLGLVGALSCAQPCFTFNGVEYCQPGTYSVAENCEIKEFQIGQDLVLPTVQLGVVGTLTCAQPCLTFNGVEYCQPGTYSVAENCEIREFQIGQDLVLPTVQLGVVGTLTCAQPCLTFNGVEYCQPGTYSVAENCEIREFQIGQDLVLPTVQLGVVGTLTCAQPCLTFNGVEYCQPGTYSVAENCEIKEFQIGQNLVLPTVPLGVVGTLTCAQPCLTFNGVEYCQPGTYSVTENCEIKEFQIGQNLVLPTVPLGVVGTLTCAQPCLTFNGVEYCQPGTYAVTENCEIKEFQIGQNLVLPTVPLGVVGTLTCTQPCLTFNGVEYCQPGTYSVTENCEIKEFQIGQNLVLPTVQLGVVGTLTCAQPCLIFNGVEYCQPGPYAVTENCEIKAFQIGQDLVLPTVPLGVVGTLTCAQPCLIFNGVEYCQPGTYAVTENCEIKAFQIGQDLALPTVQLGVVGTLTCAQPCLTFNGVEYCQPGTYTVTENCEIRDFIIGELPPVWLELGEDQTIVAGESVELLAQTNAQPFITTWHNSTSVMMPENNLDITVQPVENTLYTIEILDLNGCLLEDSVWVLVENVVGGWYAPNVIRPFSAEINGWFTLFANPNQVAEIQMLEIYDRWGNLVFARKNFPPNDPESGWNGTQNGKLFNPEVFIWQAVLLLKNGSTAYVNGDVTVLR